MALKKSGLFLLAVLMFIVAGCSSSTGGLDESAIEAKVVSEPAAVAGTPVKLMTTVEGIEALEDARIVFDIREETEEQLPTLLESTSPADKQYEATHTFPSPGKYIIYVHVYSGDDIHIIKRNEFQVN
ncbi:hypothetical protein [Paenibacillus herberti]|uniref:YtkA-like domain-containing protein n=1 Tax=Paenibacillus herberti TaxID=1619309 RepID=A0A229P298_9BACL|nr:hypothetical protein [Paenibacillus herberti]OXM16197.1 hypothetical protein CGZ75_05755 [Paenibacillus herberti]